MATTNQPKPDAEAKAIQAEVDAAEEAGHYGSKPSPVPNANYTVAGVTAGKPTPETDSKTAREAAAAARGE